MSTHTNTINLNEIKLKFLSMVTDLHYSIHDLRKGNTLKFDRTKL